FCEIPPGATRAADDSLDGAPEDDRCMQIKSRVWLAPFDFGIMQYVEIQFKHAATEPGFLEISIRLNRESGEANAWYRINKAFLHEIRKQLLIWRSFDDQIKLEYEEMILKAEREMGPGA
ncbi:MAG: hypothetical protein P8X85_23880, partial [Desulfobacterales bacterium]